MGWTTTHKPKSMPVKEFLRQQINCDNDAGTWKVLDSAIISMRTAYLAVELVRKNEGVLDLGTRRVVAFVFLLKYWPKDEYNIGYKDMDESMGPCEAECPAKILDLLTPTDIEYAIAWRAKCREHIADRQLLKVKVGQEFRTDPMTFSDGKIRSEFVVTSLKPLRFRCVTDNALVKITRRALLLALKKEKANATVQ